MALSAQFPLEEYKAYGKSIVGCIFGSYFIYAFFMVMDSFVKFKERIDLYQKAARKQYVAKSFTEWIRKHFARNFIFFAAAASLCLISSTIYQYTVYVCYGVLIMQIVQIIGLYFEKQGLCFIANLLITVGNFANIITAIVTNQCYIKGNCT